MDHLSPNESSILTGLMLLAWLEPDEQSRDLYFQIARNRYPISDETFDRYQFSTRRVLDDYQTEEARENMRYEVAKAVDGWLPLPEIVSALPIPKIRL